MAKGSFKEYNGCNFLRQRLILSVLSAKPVKITKIRHKSEDPGIRDFEASLLRLLDKITNGSKMEVSDTGTSITFKPGLLLGGRIEHDCGTEHSIGYFLEVLVALGPFCKNPLHAVLTGVTNNQIDPSVDLIKSSCLPVLKKFILDDEGLELKVQKRGAAPLGGGQVVFKCPVKRKVKPVQVVDQGKIKRVRGVAWAVRVSPGVVNRVVESAKGKLLKFLPDVYIYTDHFTGLKSGKSPGFGVMLTAETTTGVMLSAEACSNASGSGVVSVPEDVGLLAAQRLLEEIYRGGCADSLSQSLAALYMCLGQTDVSKYLVGPLSPYTIQFLKHIRDYLDLMFKLETQKKGDGDEELKLGADKVLMTCIGVGFSNLSKRTT